MVNIGIHGAAGRAIQLLTPYRVGNEQSTVKLPIWDVALAQHPNQRFVQYILNGLHVEHGFRISFQHGKAPLQQAGYNLQCPEPTIVCMGNPAGPGHLVIKDGYRTGVQNKVTL